MTTVRFHLNPRPGVPGVVVLPEAGWRRARAAILSWPWHAPTPLLDRPGEAGRLGVASVSEKDESARHGVGAAAPGAGWAVQRALSAALARSGEARSAEASLLLSGALSGPLSRLTLVCAEEEGFGPAVAAAARRFGARCLLHRPEGAAGEGWGAEAVPVAGGEAEALRAARARSLAEGWPLLTLASWPGHAEAPRDATQGGRLAVEEALGEMGGPPTHLVVAGASRAAAAAVALRAAGAAARLVTWEPGERSPLLDGAAAGAEPEGLMLAWQELGRSAHAHLSGGAGPVGALGGLDGAGRAALGLGPGSRVLAIG